ncbi:phospholipid carrier-dependent glycosyltransferase [Oscillospiraceae bacterium CM]|nr:phospholipid carrier-dependent glycosyltransferase [Oscillospiraceae bacterium CM]
MKQHGTEVTVLYYANLTIVFPVITVICLLLFFLYYWKITQPLSGTTEWIDRIINKPRLTFAFPRHRLARRDVLPMTAITLVTAVLGFFNLGDTTAPQHFFRFTDVNQSVVITLDEPTDIGSIMYYTGLWTGDYSLEFSDDGVNWQTQYAPDDNFYAMNQPHSDLFKWRYASINDYNIPTKFIRITASNTPMELGEIAIYTKFGSMVPASAISCAAAPALFDEQGLVPAAPSYLNSMYFDEIYHGRTAYENLNNIQPYETTHPPLGKEIIAVGIHLFGMTPFGWRFMGTLFGVLMIPLLYIFLKNMFGKTAIAACGTMLFAFDFMRFVQTRIATIDTYGVFFILLSYMFLYRYITQDPDTPFKKTIVPLFLSGLFFGIGCASKWTVIYAGGGLFVLYVIHLFMRAKYYRENAYSGFARYFFKTLFITGLFFLVIPAVIYCLSYIPNGLANEMRIENGMLWDPKYYTLIWDSQLFMYNYHSKLVATHAYSSTWWQWILDVRPILYYLDTSMGGGLKSAFAAFGNPVVWWGGILAVIAMAYQAFVRRDGKALFILIGYLAQLVPWLFVSRIVFIYHYFPSTLFLVLALAHVFNTIWERAQGRYKLAVFGYTGSAVLLFTAFYPVLTGLAVSKLYTTFFLEWLPTKWPF